MKRRPAYRTPSASEWARPAAAGRILFAQVRSLTRPGPSLTDRRMPALRVLIVAHTLVFLFENQPPSQAAPLEPIAPVAMNHRLSHPAPTIEPVDQQFLMKFARRTIVQQLRDGKAYESPYIPP